MFGINKICITTKELQKYNTNITINKNTMILHSIMLTLQSLVAIIYALVPYIKIFLAHNVKINIIVIVVDLSVQIMICYICLTMGCHVHLRKF